MKIVILATEASGDYLGFELIKSFQKINKKILIEGIGGPLMCSTKFRSWIRAENFNVIGIYEVLINILKFMKIIRDTEKKIRSFKPDIIISIDSPSFNYRLLKRVNDLKLSNNTKFIHYVAPTVWAWKAYRAKLFSKIFDNLFVLFKFEIGYFTKYGLKTKYVGHQIFYKNKKIKRKQKKIIFLPGSRTSEIQNNIDVFQEVIESVIKKYGNYKFYILTFKEHQNFFDSIKKKFSKKINIEVRHEKKQKIMAESHLAVAASGSVTLELAKYETPMIVVYKTHFITRVLLKLLVKVNYACLINILFKKRVVPELLFHDFTHENVLKIFDNLIKNSDEREKQINSLRMFSKKMLVSNKNPADLIVKSIV